MQPPFSLTKGALLWWPAFRPFLLDAFLTAKSGSKRDFFFFFFFFLLLLLLFLLLLALIQSLVLFHNMATRWRRSSGSMTQPRNLVVVLVLLLSKKSILSWLSHLIPGFFTLLQLFAKSTYKDFNQALCLVKCCIFFWDSYNLIAYIQLNVGNKLYTLEQIIQIASNLQLCSELSIGQIYSKQYFFASCSSIKIYVD